MKLLAILSRSTHEQEIAQINRTVLGVQMEQQAIVNGYKKEVLNLEGKLEDHLDVSVKKLGDSNGWCKILHCIKVDLELAKKNLAIAQETYTQLFA